ncbi:MAG: hypothetical protein KAI59_04900 [Planctomycetes bacterium]|nr:hypothetical protein [Planctomycetota bacterium]
MTLDVRKRVYRRGHRKAGEDSSRIYYGLRASNKMNGLLFVRNFKQHFFLTQQLLGGRLQDKKQIPNNNIVRTNKLDREYTTMAIMRNE